MAMETIKSYTDIERSKVLAEILPLDSADYFYKYCIGHYNSIYYRLETYPYNKGGNKNHDIPCWSLSALLSVLPKIYYPIKYYEELGVPIPVGQPGTNPGQLAKSEKLHYIGKLDY